MDLDQVVIALTSAFAAGFAVQQALEILDATLFVRLTPIGKRAAVAWTSLALGVSFAWFGGIRILAALKLARADSPTDVLISALFISAGTEGVNSLLKFLQYKKEEQKGEAVQTQEQAGLIAPQPPPAGVSLPAAAVPNGI